MSLNDFFMFFAVYGVYYVFLISHRSPKEGILIFYGVFLAFAYLHRILMIQTSHLKPIQVDTRLLFFHLACYFMQTPTILRCNSQFELLTP